MKSHIPATITLEEFNPALDEGFGRSQHVHGFCVSSEGDNRCVLQKKKRIADAAVFAKCYQFFLQAQSGGVINGAELEDRNQIIRHEFGALRRSNPFSPQSTHREHGWINRVGFRHTASMCAVLE